MVDTVPLASAALIDLIYNFSGQTLTITLPDAATQTPNIDLFAGNDNAGSFGGGGISLSAGFCWNDVTGTAHGGNIGLSAGAADTAGNGGLAQLLGGIAYGSGNAGLAKLRAGDSQGSGNGGDAILQSGAADSGDAGNIVLEIGQSTSGADGNLIVNSLPTADPHVVNALWIDTGTLKISAG